MLDSVNQTHLVLASAKLVLQKKTKDDIFFQVRGGGVACTVGIEPETFVI